MKTIVFVSEKGGVGKTRLADELYYFYQRTGVPVSLSLLVTVRFHFFKTL